MHADDGSWSADVGYNTGPGQNWLGTSMVERPRRRLCDGAPKPGAAVALSAAPRTRRLLDTRRVRLATRLGLLVVPVESNLPGCGSWSGGRGYLRGMSDDQEKLVDLLEGMPIGMLTTFGPKGPRSVPMARQEVEPSAESWFISVRDAAHTRALEMDPRVSLTFSARDSWVAVYGTATVVEDRDKLAELWNTFAEAWLPGGPQDPNAVLLRVDVEHGEYWDTPGGKVASLLSFAKTKLTGDTYDAEHAHIDL